jgi:hypothetical protein
MHNMKKEILLTISRATRRALVSTMMVCALVVNCLPISAGAQKLSLEKSTPEIKYLGTIQDKLLFQIEFESEGDSPMYFSIKDDNENILFTEKIKSKSFSRKFAFEKETFEGKKVTFIIHGTKESVTQTFQVARKMRMVEDIVITRL